VVGAPDGDDDSGLGIARGVHRGKGVAGVEFGIVAALLGEYLGEVAVGVAEAEAGVVVDSAAWSEGGDVFDDSGCYADAGVDEAPFGDAEG